METENKIIYLEPKSEEYDWGEGGRQWCHQDIWHPSDYEGAAAVKYILHSEHEEQMSALSDEVAKLRQDIERHDRTETALELECGAYESIANQNKACVEALEDTLAKMVSEFERVASLCAGSEAEWLIHGVLSQLNSENPSLVVVRNMPKLRTGWKYSGEYRQPQDGEYYLFCGEIKHCKGRTAGWYHIVVRSEG